MRADAEDVSTAGVVVLDEHVLIFASRRTFERFHK
jgi:hypothetical protein